MPAPPRLARAIGLGIASTILAAAPAAWADAMPKIYDSWFLPVGVSTASALHPDTSNGFAGGLELSLVHNDEFSWQGAYADVVRDFASERTRVSIGPEIGEAFLGIDGGYLLDTGKGVTRHGFCVRPMFSLGFVMIYGRLGQLFGSEHETLGEIGLLFKYPIVLHEGENPHRPMYEPEPPESPDAVEPERTEPPAQPLVPQQKPGPFAEPPPGTE
jgi:hypothetical protein